MADNNIIKIASSLATGSAQGEDYSTLLIVDTNHNSLTRYAIYSQGEYQSTVAVDTPLRKALDSAFSASTKPSYVVTGRSKGTTTLTPTSVANGAIYTFSLEVADGATVTATYTASTGDDAQDVAVGLKADIDAVSGVTAHVTATVVGTGANAVLNISLVATTDDYRVYGKTANITTSFTTTEAPADSLNGIAQFVDYTNVISTDHTPVYQAAMMAACNTLQKPYFTSSSLIENINTIYDGETAPAANDVAGVCAHAGYDYAHVMYHERASDYPEAVRVTEFTWREPGTSDWQYKKIGNFGVAQHPTEGRALNTSELLALKSKYASTVINENRLIVVSGHSGLGNRMGSGNRIETVMWGLYAASKLKQRLQNLKYRKTKIGMNDSDIALVLNTMESWLRTKISQPGRPQAINPQAKWKIEFPKARDLTFEQQSSGLLEAITATVYMDASIDAIHIVPLVLTFSDPAEV